MPVNPKLLRIQETGIMSQTFIKNTYTKFQSSIFIFGCAVVNEQVKVMTSLFEMPFLVFLIAVRKNKQHFWNPEANQTRQACFCKKILNLNK